ncbi:hypothetical protein KR222_008187 [Zaprionus bogoriensis]|nr:hypothetical protein KR222_008187 [Zaprionus bogoriensis]
MSSLLATPAGVPAAASASSSAPASASSNAAAGQNVGGNASSGSSSGSSNSGNNNNSNNNLPFEKDKIWYFSNEQLGNSPSRRCGIKSDDELHYRQMTAYLIQEMGQRLQVSQLCINTAIVYMHRFYAFHSFTHFHRNSMASASLFLAAKVEEQPRKLEHVIRAANKCLPQTTEQSYADLAQELVFNENVLLQTLGFDVAIDHPHTHVVKTCQLVKACKDLAQTSYFLASNSLHLTSMCLQYRPTVVACFCIYLACKWSRWEIPQSTEGKHWFYYVDKSVSLELLKQLTDEFIAIYEKSPARLKSKLNSIKAIAQGASNRTASNSKDSKPKEDWKMSEMIKGYHSNITAPPELMNGSDGRDQAGSQAQQQALLPPPTMVPSQQRRNDGGHQRSSSSSSSSVAPGNSSSTTSSSSSSSNHKLPNYPGALPPDAHGGKSPRPYRWPNNKSLTLSLSLSLSLCADHKSKQPGYSSRAPSSHQSSSSSSSAQRSSSGSSSSSSSQRSSSGQQSGRPPMPMDYHKSARGMPPIGMQPHGAHKMSSSSKPPQQQQQQPPPQLLDGRSNSSASNASVSSKDMSKSSSSSSSTGSGSSSNKMYPNAPPSYNNSGPPNPLMSRGGYQGSSSSSGNTGGSSSSGAVGVPGGSSSSSSNGAAASSGYGSHGSSHRNKSVSSSSSSSSVHSMPPYEQQLPYGQSQGVPSYNHMQQQQQQQQQLPSLDAAQQQQQLLAKNNSLFSPEWSDIKKEPHFNGLLPPPPPPGPAGHESLGYKLNSHARDRDSPKKERLTPTKKDKHRSSSSSGSSGSGALTHSSASGSGSGSGSGAGKSMLPPHKKPHGELLSAQSANANANPNPNSNPNELAGPSRDAGNLKRANEISGSQYGLNKLDEHDGSLPRDKVRKLDNSVGLPGYANYEAEKHTPLSMSNGGIETTPDLVRSLLKESLCTTNKSLLKPDPLTMPGLKPPAELLEPMPSPVAQQLHIKKEPLAAPTNLGAAMAATVGMGVAAGATQALPSVLEADALTKLGGGSGGDAKDLDSSGKSEKKKKKDKHKHKEKDKSKDKPDKEERKKHKKDKQKERSSKDTSMDSLKLVIKTGASSAANPNGSLQVGAAAPLKLKISKNKVEPNNYSAAGGLPVLPTAPGYGLAPSSSAVGAATTTTTTSAAAPGGPQLSLMPPYSTGSSGAGGAVGGAYSTSNSNSSSSGSGSSSKKKHSDRDRDKESKKSKTQDYAKYNGVGVGVGVGIGVPVSGSGGVYASLGGAGAVPNAQTGVGLLGLGPQSGLVAGVAGVAAGGVGPAAAGSMTTSTSNSSMVMIPPVTLPAGMVPSALPIYNKK